MLIDLLLATVQNCGIAKLWHDTVEWYSTIEHTRNENQQLHIDRNISYKYNLVQKQRDIEEDIQNDHILTSKNLSLIHISEPTRPHD